MIRHRVLPAELEEIMSGDLFYLEYQAGGDEERYKVLSATKAGRIVIAVWTPREDKVRAVTAYGATRSYRKLYWETRG
ncbi:MAG: BrnT family toxin [Acidobacteria bacterium]|nr:BrnT family toxin [Acidobacteriota bacterium]